MLATPRGSAALAVMTRSTEPNAVSNRSARSAFHDQRLLDAAAHFGLKGVNII